MPLRVLALFVFALMVASLAFAEDSPPDSIRHHPPSIQVVLKSGEMIRAERVSINTLGSVTVTRLDGTVSAYQSTQIRSVTDEQGHDRTKDLLNENEVVRVGDPEPRVKEPAPPAEKGFHGGLHAGAAMPVGNFHGFAATGPALDLTAQWRTGMSTVFGARIGYASFGGTAEHEGDLSEDTAGAIDQISYRTWSLSGFVRGLILPKHRVNPFLEFGLRVGVFPTSWSGTGGSGSQTTYSLSTQYGIGLHVKTSHRTAVEVLTELTAEGTDDHPIYGDQRFSFLQFKVGIVRRLGGD